MIESISLNIKIKKTDKIERHNFQITCFMFRKLHVIYKKKFYLRTKTELLKWIDGLLKEITCN